MDKQEYCCLFENFSETTAKGTVLAKTTGKEVPVELDFRLCMFLFKWCSILGRGYMHFKSEIPERFFSNVQNKIGSLAGVVFYRKFIFRTFRVFQQELQSCIVCIGRILCLCVQAKLNDPRIEEFS